ncbi:winged helix DNA-binding protein [Sediminitomix flava]|uniref:Winged helix DNA-binding protein n=2 Tax=Sediminitomix flava TaxID=379075 RepID=A0A316A0S3_SEDFL|nr:winged helix DNA-binding protein [Sediminitomix flava]
MSETLKTSHSAVSQMMSNLERRALVEIKKDPEDKRRRNVQLTEKGKELLAQVRPIWNGLQKAMAEILEQDEFNAKLISIIDNIEATFDEEELSERILRQL